MDLHTQYSACIGINSQINRPTTASLHKNSSPLGALLLGTFASEASSHWDLRLNLYDLELARDYFTSKYLSIRPHVGLRGATIKQTIKAKYLGGIYAGEVVYSPTSMNAKNYFYGIGPRVGANLLWQFVSHWGLYGNISGSLLYGKFHASQQYSGQMSLQITEDETIEVFSTPGNFQEERTPWRVRTNIDSGVGLEWETFFAKTLHLTLGVGYEISYWFKQLQLLRSAVEEYNFINLDVSTEEYFPLWTNAQEEDGDLAMQGWNFHVRFDF